MADLIERKSLKLLAQAWQVLNQIVSEAQWDEPHRKLMQALLGLGVAFAAGVAAICQLTEGADNHPRDAPNSQTSSCCPGPLG